MMEQELQFEWPHWPALILQGWLMINNLETEVNYQYWKIGKVSVVYISTIKSFSGDEKFIWPIYPINHIQKYLNLDLGSEVTYEFIQDRLAAVWIKNSKLDRDAFIKAVEQSLEDLINE